LIGSAFWVVRESFGMTMGDAAKTISVIRSMVALIALGKVLVIDVFPALPA
jgi:gluconate:H+ symporter, GntP family